MSLELVTRQGFLPSTPTFRVTSTFKNHKRIGSTVSIPATSSLEEMLKQIGHLPSDCLFFGYAEDDLPVLLNLKDSTRGPILISADPGAGKTNLLKVVAKFATLKYDPCEIQLGVITDHPQEWQDQLDFPHCIGLFSMREKCTTDFIKALTAWTDRRHWNGESVLLLIDGLDDFAHYHRGLLREMNKILVQGPERKIWTVVTSNPRQQKDAETWLKYFHTRIFGYTKYATLVNDPCLPETTIQSLFSGREFLLKENESWIKFRIPKT